MLTTNLQVSMDYADQINNHLPDIPSSRSAEQSILYHTKLFSDE